MSKNTPLIPNYVDADFNTLKQRLIQLLSQNEIFKDYDFEGANITILLELISYLGDLNTFYTNKLAKNIHPETADIYEVVHSLVKQQGHEARGYIAAKLNIDVTIDLVTYNDQGEVVSDISYDIEQGDQLLIPKWFKIDTGLTDESTGRAIYYFMNAPFYYTVTSDDAINRSINFELSLRQGQPVETPLTYTGSDLIDNKIILPFRNWDYGDYPYSSESSSDELMVGETEERWTRVGDFYDKLSELYEEQDAYMFVYDKYRRYAVQFSGTRNQPGELQNIRLVLAETLGIRGNIARNTITELPETDSILGVPDVPFITNITKDFIIPIDNCRASQESSSFGAADPQTIDELKESGLGEASSQKRNVTIQDYIGYISNRSDVVKANVWGEKEKNPGSIFIYNKVYISLIPRSFNEQTITTRQVDVTGEFSDDPPDTKEQDGYQPDQNNLYVVPVDFDEDWGAEISRYIEPRKMINLYEQYIVPELVYFRFDFGLRVKRTYNYSSVKNAILNKLRYYFRPEIRNFGEEIDFREVYNYIMDNSVTSDGYDFAPLLGINTLVIRDVLTYTPSLEVSTVGPLHVYEEESPHPYDKYPYFVADTYDDDVENTLASIKVGFNQFPMIAINQCKFVNEGR